MNTARILFKREEDSNGDIFRKNIPIKILGGSEIQINDKCTISNDTQNVFTGKTEKLIKKLNDGHRVTYYKISASPI